MADRFPGEKFRDKLLQIKKLYLKGATVKDIRREIPGLPSKSAVDEAIRTMKTGENFFGKKVKIPVRISASELKKRDISAFIPKGTPPGFIPPAQLIAKMKEKGLAKYYTTNLEDSLGRIAKYNDIEIRDHPTRTGYLYKEPTAEQWVKWEEKIKPSYAESELNKTSQFLFNKDYEKIKRQTNPRNQVLKTLKRNEGKYPGDKRMREIQSHRSYLLPKHKDFFSKNLPDYSAADLEKDLKAGKDHLDITNEQFAKNKRKILKRIEGTKWYARPNVLMHSSLLSKIKLDPEYKKLWKKNVKPPVKWTRKDYNKRVMKLLPLAIERGDIPKRLDSGKVIDRPSRYFTYVRQKQINPIEKLFGYTERMGTEHPMGIARSVHLQDPTTLARVVPMLDAATRNPEKGAAIDAIASRQVQNVLKSKVPEQGNKALIALNKIIKKGRDTFKIPIPFYKQKGKSLVPTVTTGNLDEPLIKNARVAIDQYIDLGGDKRPGFSKLLPDLQTSIRKFAEGNRALGNRFLRTALRRAGPLGLVGLIGYNLATTGSLEASEIENAPEEVVNLQTAGFTGGKTIPKVDLVPGSVDQVSEEVIQEPGTTELEAQDITIEEPASMAYNATEGNFVNAEGERETQPGMLNWIADNPTKSSLAALPLMMGAGFGLDKAGSKFGNESVARSGLKSAGKYLTGWKALIPAMMIPHALYEYKAGHDIPEMVTNPINALWALGIRGEKDLKLVKDYYDDMKKVGRRGLDMTTLKGLKSVKGWKSLPRDFQTAMMSPAAKGTNMAFGTTFRKPFVKTMGALDGIAATQGAKAWGKKALLRAALIPAGILAATPAGWLTAGFLGADFLWDQYKDYRDGNVRIDEMRARGSISEDEAKNYRSLLLQGSIPFGMGNRMFGPDTMRIGGEDLDPTQQRELLKGMEAQLDEWQGGDMERRAKFREDHFADGGRVGMKFGGEMDRRTFLKWLGALAAGATGIFKGKSKDVVKPLVVDATKTIPAKFVGVEGMPAWFPRLIAKIKTHGKLIEMADKKYIQGDIYEMVIPVKVPKFDRVAGKEQMSGFETVNKKIVMEDNPLSGEIEITWSVEDFDGEMTRQINFKPGTAGYQKFGVDPEHPTAWEYQRVKVEEPEFSYGNPDQANPYREEFEYKDIFTQADEVVDGMEALTKTKQMVAKDGSVIDVSAEGKGVDKEFQKKMYKDIEGEGALQADPEGQMTPEGWQGEGTPEFIEGDIPDWVPKDEWPKKAAGGIIETGNIARRPGAVPPLSGPTPQGEGIVGLFSNPKQVNVGS